MIAFDNGEFNIQIGNGDLNIHSDYEEDPLENLPNLIRIKDAIEVNTNGLLQVFTVVLLYILYEATCIVRVQQLKSQRYIKVTLVVYLPFLVVTIAENVIYKFFLPETKTFMIIDTLKPCVLTGFFAFLTGHMFFGYKIWLALKKHTDFQKRNSGSAIDFGRMKALIVYVCIYQVQHLFIHIINVAFLAYMKTETFRCLTDADAVHNLGDLSNLLKECSKL